MKAGAIREGVDDIEGITSLISQYIEDHIRESYYRNDPKFSDRKVWANSADPDQSAPRGAV